MGKRRKARESTVWKKKGPCQGQIYKFQICRTAVSAGPQNFRYELTMGINGPRHGHGQPSPGNGVHRSTGQGKEVVPCSRYRRYLIRT
jgi:hypothetical protein